jgi:hypothetical protein
MVVEPLEYFGYKLLRSKVRIGWHQEFLLNNGSPHFQQSVLQNIKIEGIVFPMKKRRGAKSSLGYYLERTAGMEHDQKTCAHKALFSCEGFHLGSVFSWFLFHFGDDYDYTSCNNSENNDRDLYSRREREADVPKSKFKKNFLARVRDRQPFCSLASVFACLLKSTLYDLNGTRKRSHIIDKEDRHAK